MSYPSLHYRVLSRFSSIPRSNAPHACMNTLQLSRVLVCRAGATDLPGMTTSVAPRGNSLRKVRLHCVPRGAGRFTRLKRSVTTCGQAIIVVIADESHHSARVTDKRPAATPTAVTVMTTTTA